MISLGREHILCKIICQGNVKFCYTKENSALLRGLAPIGPPASEFRNSETCLSESDAGQAQISFHQNVIDFSAFLWRNRTSDTVVREIGVGGKDF